MTIFPRPARAHPSTHVPGVEIEGCSRFKGLEVTHLIPWRVIDDEVLL
jgi:hypothetical protein